jgi:glyoxylase-like metal-dependent hydrolase (beta-lactamase superfamily II)
MVETRGQEATPIHIVTIRLAGVNCYLISARNGCVLVDSSKPEKRPELEEALTEAGCVPGTLRLIALTHGDYDHAGNAAYLRETYKAEIAMHRADAERVEQGDWSLDMKPTPDKFGLLFRAAALFIKPGPFETFTPDVDLADGASLSDFGLDATVLHLPGHTKGSIGVLTGKGDLFCGDLFDSMMGRPTFEFFIDDMAAAKASLSKLRTRRVGMVYPGHGKPFRFDSVA